MNTERIKELAYKAADGMLSYDAEGGWRLSEREVQKFAELIAAKEREACAKLCDAIDAEYEGEDVLATWCAEAIRARGNK